jgi:ribonuclease P protein component
MPFSQRLSRSEVTSLLNNPEIKVIFNRLGTLKYQGKFNSDTLHTPKKAALTVVTSSKNQKKAVLRNKIRRQIYSLFRTYINKNKDISVVGILYVSKQVYMLSFNETSSLFEALMNKI